MVLASSSGGDSLTGEVTVMFAFARTSSLLLKLGFSIPGYYIDSDRRETGEHHVL